MAARRTIHRVEARAIPVNAYVVEGHEHVVVVDATLTVSDGRALRERVEAIGKPLAGVLITHAHPDHYGGLVELLRGLHGVPSYAASGVIDAIRRDDAGKESVLRPMFGEEWPLTRRFPERGVPDGSVVEPGHGLRFRLVDLGPGESPHDSAWLLESESADRAPRIFCGDLVYNHMHGYLADGHYQAWLANLERARSAFSVDSTLYMGHGQPSGTELLDWQAGYIRTFVDAVLALGAGDDDEAATEAVTAVMRRYLPSDQLQFLMQLSVPVLRRALAERHSTAVARS